MPTVTYKGPKKCGGNMGRLGFWEWGIGRDMSKEWISANLNRLGNEFTIDGEMVIPQIESEANTTPDMKWTKGDIMTWMDENEIIYSAISTKTNLLKKINAHQNPTEEIINEGRMEEPTGDE